MPVVRKTKSSTFLRWVNARPGRVIATSFLLVILVGSALLILPFASRDRRSIGLLQAVFTATSATCVTGLVTVDTATHWSLFGKVVILALIQIGGLGLVTITSFFYTFMRRKATLKTMMTAQESTASFGFVDVMRLVRKIILITFVIEMTGGLILSWRLSASLGWARGIGKGFFLAVSAFCNAGFDLLGDTAGGPFSSLVAYRDDPVLLLTVSLLIILGGLGFVVWSDLLELPRSRRLKFHSKVVLAWTGILLAAGTVLILAAEGNGRFLDAVFQSVTSRTAGFNSIDQAGLSDGAKFTTIILMFIGAAPGSTAGGIKITTFAIVAATILSDIRGRDNILLMRHRLPRETFTRAFAIVGLALSIVLSVTLLLSLVERPALERGSLSFLDLLFETTSAFATVGLSAAGTPGLSPWTWAILIPVMYLGRVGPASFAISLAMQRPAHKEPVYPEGRTLVG
ncbi:MAG: Trk family potassium uptake protein [Clostridiaceae bacterium]|nr:Trk family potassium uptake protein [Clostridiaceae bacterium]